MNGKDKCRILKDIRRQIAQENEIEWVVSECKHKGNCKGTCPKCESEVRQLEQALENRRRLGKVVAVAGVSAACLTGLTACTLQDVVDYGTELIEEIKEAANSSGCVVSGNQTGQPDIPEPIELDGDVAYIPDDLSGYMEYDPDYYELDGEVAIEPMTEAEVKPFASGLFGR